MRLSLKGEALSVLSPRALIEFKLACSVNFTCFLQQRAANLYLLDTLFSDKEEGCN